MRSSSTGTQNVRAWKEWFRQFGDYFHARRLEIIKLLVSEYRNSSALDVGCAQSILSAMGLPEVVGIDIRRGLGLTVLASAEYLPFQNDCFQIVFAGEVIEHLGEPALALKEWVRVLKAGGRMIISTPNGLRVRVSAGNPEHKRMFSPSDLIRSIEHLGLTVIYIKAIFLGILPGRRLFRWIPFDSVKMALLRLPVPLAISYSVFISGEKIGSGQF